MLSENILRQLERPDKRYSSCADGYSERDSANGARVGEISDGTTTLHLDFGEQAGRALKIIRLSR